MRNISKLIILIAAVILPTAATAQDEVKEKPVRSVVFDLYTTQTAYSDSWVGGEAGSFNWVANLNATNRKHFGESFVLRSSLKLSFGQTTTQDEKTRDWSKPKKSTDLMDFENVGSANVGWEADPYVAFRVESQFYDGSFPQKKLFLSPMKLTESAGFTQMFFEQDKDFLVTRLGVALKQTITKFISDTATLATSSLTSGEAGFESVSEIEKQIHPNIRYLGKLSLFKALTFTDKDDVKGTPEENNWKAVDVNFENRFVASVTKIIAVNLYLQMLYDKEISRKTRLKETLALGIVFKLI